MSYITGNTFMECETGKFIHNWDSEPEGTEVFVFPTSFAQQRLWFLDQLVPGNPFYNVSTALRLTGVVNLTALKQTFNKIIERHETLRTTFLTLDGQIMQAIAPTLTISLPVIDLRHLQSQEREIEARRLTIQEAQRPFNLTTGPLLRVTLLQLDEAEYLLLLNLHHIVADGWSISVLVRELGNLYATYKDVVSTSTSPLPELPIQYADFAQWQREWLQGPCLQTQLAYWGQQLDGISVLNLPSRPRPVVASYKGAKQFLNLPQSLTQGLEQLSHKEGATLFMTLLAAFGTLLYRYTQQDDIIVGSPIANRNRSELEGLIGFFVNSLVLRTDLSGNPTFQELLNRVREVTLAAYAHQDLPFEKLVEELHPQRDLSRNPLFQVVFSLQNTPINTLELPGLKLSLFDFDSKTTKVDLELHLWQDSESLKGQVVYSTDLFDDATITRMLGHFQTLLESIVASPEQRLCHLPFLTQIEWRQLLVEFNQNQSKIRNSSHPNRQLAFPQLFEAQVKQNAQATAVVFEDVEKSHTTSLTYEQLNIQANQLAHHLQKLGVATDIVVGICVERSLEMIVGLLGILKAGGAYLPLDPTYPQERLNFMLEDARVSVLLTQKNLIEHFENFSKRIICVDEDFTQHKEENLTNRVTFDNLAYIIYTSGSTGKPKGVLIAHRGLFNLVQAQIEVFNLQPSNHILQFASLSFDASIFEIVMALATGATLYLAKKETLFPGQPLLQILREKAITHVVLPPAVLAILPVESLPKLQTIICAGESCSEEIVKRWWIPNRRFFNAYGPTEATVWSTVAEISVAQKPPIGRPIANTEIYILDQHLQPVPIGIPGELYIGGEGLARGYINHPELTAQKFISHPFNHQKEAKIYKTGDLAQYRPDGNIEFLGRIDHQVKMRGFRIELSEIEAVLNQHQSVQKAVVIAQDNLSEDKKLVAYIVPNLNNQEDRLVNDFNLPLNKQQLQIFASKLKPGGEIESRLVIWLKEKLPEYMIPKTFIMLHSLPLTANGKVDFRALTALDIPTNHSIEQNFINPRTPTELTLAKIWAEVLNIERVGIHDNFFDLGGDSLLSVRLLEQIHKQFERDLPLSTLFLNPTIETLATSLSSDKDSLAWSPLIPIQPAGSNPPFFCVHPIFGVVFPYYELAHHLGKNQPFYGLQPIGLDGKTPLTHIEDMAAHYIQALRSVQPKGPYFLGGWSFGGWVAFEMAQQLQKSGEEVALLAVLDTLAPIPGNIPSFGNAFKFLLTTVARYIWPFFLDYFFLITASVKSQINNLTSRFPNFHKFIHLKTNLFSQFILGEAATAKVSQSRLEILRELAIGPMLRIFYANNQAVRNYVPQVYPKRINLFKTKIQSSIVESDAKMGWDQLVMGGTEIHPIPGNHLTMLRKPHVQVLAAQLKACMEKAQSWN